MDKLYQKDLSSIFLRIALAVVKKYQIFTNFSHLDSSSFSVQGKYLDLNSITNKTQEISEFEPKIYQFTAYLEINQAKVNELQERAGRFILATNQLEKSQLSSDDILIKYKEQQAPERGFAFLKDPLFFALLYLC